MRIDGVCITDGVDGRSLGTEVVVEDDDDDDEEEEDVANGVVDVVTDVTCIGDVA